MWLESAWAWLYGNIVWLLPSGAIAAWAGRTGGALLLEVLRERRSANADRRKAATEFAHIADAYRRYWVTKHYDDLNAEPDTESFVQWSGDPFTPLVTPEHRALHARLPPALRDQAYTLDQKVKETKERIRGLAEFREEDIDIDAPILVAEIAIAADNLYRRVMRAAGLRPADEYDAISDIKGRLVRYRNDKEKSETANRRANAEMFGQNSG